MGNICRPKMPFRRVRQLDSIHIHIDETGTSNLIQSIIRALEKNGAEVKTTYIRSSIAGPQRNKYSDMYHFHALGGDAQEKFKAFFTIRLGSNNDHIQALRLLLPVLSNARGVVEVERVVGIVDEGGGWSEVPQSEVKFIDSSDVGFERSHTLPLEIHYAFNIPKERSLQKLLIPLSLEQLLGDCISLGIYVGEWLLLEKANRWAYRSNMFAETDISLDLVREQHQKLVGYLNTFPFSHSSWAMIEEVLGVWKMPLLPTQSS